MVQFLTQFCFSLSSSIFYCLNIYSGWHMKTRPQSVNYCGCFFFSFLDVNYCDWIVNKVAGDPLIQFHVISYHKTFYSPLHLSK